MDSPEKIQTRLKIWKRKFKADKIYWRHFRTDLEGKFYVAKGYKNLYKEIISNIKWDDFEIVPDIFHSNGVKAYLYVSLFDEGCPLPSKRVRKRSFLNDRHWQHISWQSRFVTDHPEFLMVDRTGNLRHNGVLCLAYPEVRKHLLEKYLRLLNGYSFDGLFICLRSQSKPPEYADQFGFNEPIREDFMDRYGRDICKEDSFYESNRCCTSYFP